MESNTRYVVKQMKRHVIYRAVIFICVVFIAIFAILGVSMDINQLPVASASEINNEQLTVNVSGNDIDENESYYIDLPSVNYNGGQQTPQAFLKQVGNDGFVRQLLVECSEDCIDAKTYDVTIPAQNGDYTFDADITAQFTVTPFETEITWDDVTTSIYEYSGSALGPKAKYTDIDGNEVRLEAEISGYGINASTVPYTAKIDIDKVDSNYKLTGSLTCSYIISPKNVSVQWEGGNSFVYNGQKQGPKPYYFDINRSKVYLTNTYEQGLNAREAYYTAGVSENDVALGENYKLTGSLTCNYTISKSTVSVQWEGGNSFVYNGQKQSPKPYYIDINSVKVYLINIYEQGLNASDKYYLAGVRESDAALGTNYKLIGLLTKEYKIDKLNVKVGWKTGTYTYDGSAQGPKAQVCDAATGNPISFEKFEVTGYGLNKGDYTATVNINRNNFNVESGSLTQTYTIEAKSKNVEWENSTNYTYNGKAQGPKAWFEDEIGNKIYLAVNGEIGAGSHTAHVDKDAAGINYVLTGTECQYIIQKRNATVRWSWQTAPDNLVENGAEQGPIAYFIGNNNEEILLPISGTGSKAGEYTATVNTQEFADNYNFDGDLTFEYTILPKPVVKKPVLGGLGIAFLVLFLILLVGIVTFVSLKYFGKNKYFPASSWSQKFRQQTSAAVSDTQTADENYQSNNNQDNEFDTYWWNTYKYSYRLLQEAQSTLDWLQKSSDIEFVQYNSKQLLEKISEFLDSSRDKK